MVQWNAVSRTEFSNAAFHKARGALGELGVVSRVSVIGRTKILQILGMLHVFLWLKL